jgi:hypothetical protein
VTLHAEALSDPKEWSDPIRVGGCPFGVGLDFTHMATDWPDAGAHTV